MIELLQKKVLEWAEDKGLTGLNGKATPLKQAEKTLEEANELLVAIQTNDRHETIDAIGDVMVTLIIQCELQALNLDECLLSAYNVIKNRTGKMVGGTFVKDK